MEEPSSNRSNYDERGSIPILAGRGGAIGDALGGAVEFIPRAEILQRFGPEGISDYADAYGGKGKITDDTQMTLFTAEGLLGGLMRGVSRGTSSFDHTVANAYLRWLTTQGYSCRATDTQTTGWLFRQQELHSQRAPGMTCLSALQDYSGEPGIAPNDSKGCGGVMRVAPVGLFWWLSQGIRKPWPRSARRQS